MKYIILIGDGMGDFPLAELGGKTPLAAAATPAMDWLANQGELLRVQTIPTGMAPGSDVANLALMGYRPQDCYSGRAPLEAASLGVTLAPDEIAFRCNFVTLDDRPDGGSVAGVREGAGATDRPDGGNVAGASDGAGATDRLSGQIVMADYSAGHITTAEAAELIQALQSQLGDARVHFHPGVSYRHLLVHKGELAGLETVPPHDHTGRDVAAYYHRYLQFPHLQTLLTEARAILASHPVNTARREAGKKEANAIWLWGEGKPPAMETLRQRFGLEGALISAVDLVKGIGVYAGLEIIAVPGATGYLDTNYLGKAQAALAALTGKDFVFVHVEAPDEAGHQGLVREKIQSIEDFDRKIVQPVLDGLASGPDFRLLVGMDHLTPIALRTHASHPVPFVLYDSRRPRQQQGFSFSEADADGHGTFLDSGAAMFARLIEGS